MSHQNHPTWPKKDNVHSLYISYFDKTSDNAPSSFSELTDQKVIDELFRELYKLNPLGNGMMKKIWPDSSHISILISYEDMSIGRVSIYGWRVQSADTSFYTEADELRQGEIFRQYIESLIHEK